VLGARALTTFVYSVQFRACTYSISMSVESNSMEEVSTYISGYECIVCGSVHSREKDVVQHLRGKNDNEHTNLNTPLEEYVNEVSNNIDSELLESLYVANKHAKKFSNRATQSYRQGRKAKAKELSNKKKALYTLKEKVLEQIQHEAEKVSIHEIDNTDFYCFYFTDEKNTRWSFHCPKQSFWLDDNITASEEEVGEFSKSSDVERSNKNLKPVLLFFKQEHQFNANRFVPNTYQPMFGTNYRVIDSRWNYL